MYKSLEHIIREIKEGKSSSEKKKDSLEGAIRKVQRKEYESSYAARDSKPVDEDDIKLAKDYDESIEEMNVVTNPGGQMTGRQFSTRSPIIAPRKDSDDGHGQSSKNVSIQRNKAIQKFSAKNVSLGGRISEEQIDEAPLVRLPVRIPPKTQKPFAEPPAKIELPPVAPAPETIAPSVKTPPKAPPVEAPPKIKTPTETPPKAPPVEAPPKIKTPTETPPKVEVPTEKPKIEPSPQQKTEPETKIKIPDAQPPGKDKVPPPVTPPGKTGKLMLPTPYFTAVPVQYMGPLYGSKTSLSRAKSIPVTNLAKHSKNMREDTQTRKLIQNMPRKDAGDRHDIELVGRKDSDPKSSKEKTSRQAEYKMKIIDEGKKLAEVIKKVRKESGDGKTKVYDNVIINPDLNRIDNRDPQN